MKPDTVKIIAHSLLSFHKSYVDHPRASALFLSPYRSGALLGTPPAEQGRVVVLPGQGGGNFSGCVWLQICGNSAAFFTLPHRQVLDLLEWLGSQIKFPILYSPVHSG